MNNRWKIECKPSFIDDISLLSEVDSMLCVISRSVCVCVCRLVLGIVANEMDSKGVMDRIKQCCLNDEYLIDLFFKQRRERERDREKKEERREDEERLLYKVGKVGVSLTENLSGSWHFPSAWWRENEFNRICNYTIHENGLTDSKTNQRLLHHAFSVENDALRSTRMSACTALKRKASRCTRDKRDTTRLSNLGITDQIILVIESPTRDDSLLYYSLLRDVLDRSKHYSWQCLFTGEVPRAIYWIEANKLVKDLSDCCCDFPRRCGCYIRYLLISPKSF